jgi:hypothetical protein
MRTSNTISAEHAFRGDAADQRRGLLRRLRDGLDACADYYAAAAIYEQLSRLSDAELQRRGLARETLARDIAMACDRTTNRSP